MLCTRFLFPLLPPPAPACTHSNFSASARTQDVCELLQRSRFGSTLARDADNGDGCLMGGLQQLSALGAQSWDLRDLGLILFQLHRKLNENKPVPAFYWGNKKGDGIRCEGLGDTQGEVLGTSLNK